MVSLTYKTSILLHSYSRDWGQRPETSGIQRSAAFINGVEKIKICLSFSMMLFTICAHDSFILGQQMGFFEM